MCLPPPIFRFVFDAAVCPSITYAIRLIKVTRYAIPTELAHAVAEMAALRIQSRIESSPSSMSRSIPTIPLMQFVTPVPSRQTLMASTEQLLRTASSLGSPVPGVAAVSISELKPPKSSIVHLPSSQHKDKPLWGREKLTGCQNNLLRSPLQGFTPVEPRTGRANPSPMIFFDERKSIVHQKNERLDTIAEEQCSLSSLSPTPVVV